jgi:UDP-3-O-[3-hydroxymyristoyl] glucosamine N-acyltransferase
VGAGCYIGDDVEIGEATELKPNVTIYQAVQIGQGCLIHSGSVIGADGFGFAPTAQGWLKIHQLGSVIIGNKVEIGANSCIDRGALDNTIIEDGVIIDNLVQIAHNVKIGRNTAIAGHTAIAGSTTIGSQCTIAGAVGIVGHLQIADKVHITAMSLVTSSITEPGSYSSGTAMSNTKDWRKNAARFRQLDELANRLQKLEREQKS